MKLDLAEFKGGRSPVNVVLQSQQRRANAQIDYYRALGEYNKSINYVDYLKGTMLANSNITLAEGPWNKKAYWDALERARERSAGKKGQYGVSRPGVVRRGPVCDAESVAAGAACTVDPSTQPLSPDGIIMQGPASDAIMYESELNNQPLDMGDIPLGDMGSPSEMFAPPSNMEFQPAPRSQTPGVVPNGNVPATPNLIPTPEPDPVLNGPLHNTKPTSFNERTSYETEIGDNGNPEPVSRKALPIP